MINRDNKILILKLKFCHLSFVFNYRKRIYVRLEDRRFVLIEPNVNQIKPEIRQKLYKSEEKKKCMSCEEIKLIRGISSTTLGTFNITHFGRSHDKDRTFCYNVSISNELQTKFDFYYLLLSLYLRQSYFRWPKFPTMPPKGFDRIF